ncbi:MAG: NAD(P)H-dependent oxidoreductase subunit E [Desulfobacterota bacterium]|nr:NAD(P)H-dependent oxidoreductase subunit E [Thermodesulfobacteriota bacterium]
MKRQTVSIEHIFAQHRRTPDDLIPLLQDIQHHYGHLPESALRQVAAHLGLSSARVFSVASFYGGFSFTPTGKNRIEVCHGTACHIRGSTALTAYIGRTLHIEPGQTSADGVFSLHTVRCLGCCALAPVMKINDTVYPGVAPYDALSILEQYR